MTHTTNFNLSQWSKSDRIQMADFNADNAKIDAALAALSGCNCRCYSTTYTGDGAFSRTFIFPGKPMFLAIANSSGFTLAVRGTNKGVTMFSANYMYAVTASWGDTSVTLSYADNSVAPANRTNISYDLFAILEVG